MKYIVITGGICSSIGKGITSSSIGVIFTEMGYKVTMIKIDPYINIDAGLMSPYEHGECYVLEDGGECDLDLGNYERFLGISLTKNHNITTGRIYQNVINKERRGDYLGATVQVVPHITNEIIDQIIYASNLPIDGKIPDLCIIELGGTVGDIEGLPFIEALQQMRLDHEFCFLHVGMVIENPEIKTKPIQHSISNLRSRGIFPDLLIVRSSEHLNNDTINKLHRLCQIRKEDIISNYNISSIYYIPQNFVFQNIHYRIASRINLNVPNHNLKPFSNIINYLENKNNYPTRKLAIIGKYTNKDKSNDTYLSIMNAIEHASFKLQLNINVILIDSEDLPSDLSIFDYFIIAGGFGSRGIEGKLKIAEYARLNNIPILGICLGFQIMVVEYYNNICSNGKATSTEWSNDTNLIPLIDILPQQNENKGGTLRLGNYKTILSDNTKIKNIYNTDVIYERHRHRYEVNNNYISIIEYYGGKFSGRSENNLMEIFELPNHKFYIGTQFHPEYNSKCLFPHPIFLSLLQTK